MDFAGFCYEAVRVFLQMGRDAFFFCPDIWEGCQRRVLVRALVRRVSRGIPRRYIPCRWYEFWKGKVRDYDGKGIGRAERCGYPDG